MRVCDYITDQAYRAGAKNVFIVTGGGQHLLTDGIAAHPELKAVPCHHEQAAAMAAVAYAKYTGFGYASLTTGCGATNAITGVLHAYQDNTPCLFVSGQCGTKEILASVSVPLRQLGMQEADIVSIVKSITKYAVTIMNPADTVYEVEKAIYTAKSGRPGPVWLDIPADIQGAEIDPDTQKHFKAPERPVPFCTDEDLNAIIRQLKKAKRPLIVAGQGIRLSGAVEEFKRFIEANQIPFVYSRLGFDAYPNQRDLSVGAIGRWGTRAGNFALQNADFLLVLGSRLSLCVTGEHNDLFAREATVYTVDVDEYEHRKNTVHIERAIVSDAKYVLEKLSGLFRGNFREWAAVCKNWKEKYPPCLAEHYDDAEGLSLYAFCNEMSKRLPDDAVVVTDAGSTCFVTPQAMWFRSDAQRYLPSGAQAEMGFTLPACVGACFASGRRPTVGIVGDGSLQMNLQELQTIRHNDLPVKLFVWNNSGYMSIRRTQERRFKRKLGVDADSGTSFPDLQKICAAYGIEYIRLEKNSQYEEVLAHVMEAGHPIVCEVMCRYEEMIMQAWGANRDESGRMIRLPLEDLAPLLPREEFYANMIVRPVS